MKSLKIKVCGMRDAENIAELIELPIDYIGFIFYEKSPRYVELMPQLINSDKFKKINKVGVFVNADIDFVLDKITKFGLNTIQLHGKETPQYLIDLKIKIKELISNKLSPTVNNLGLRINKIKSTITESQLNINKLEVKVRSMKSDAYVERNIYATLIDKIKSELINNYSELNEINSELQLIKNDSESINNHLKISIWKAFSIDEQFDFNNTKPYEQLADVFLFDTKTPQHGGSGQKFNWDLLQNYRGETPFFLSGGISTSDTEEVKSITHPKFFGLDLNSKFEISAAFKDIELLGKFIDSVRLP